ncbi:SAV_2336 N-terminal domain-related protein [Streptomyces sp. NPDC004126]|uniref:SAV_2336 N-terminal domain-related protein n=1 Tax=Streptomyces sp. NPDC004126 TaxID=3390695 RepID=UPI003D07101E
MIERLLAALAEGAEDGAAPRTVLGPEEIADILWLAARVDPAGAGSPDDGVPPPGPDGPDGPDGAQEPPPGPDGPAPGTGRAGPDADGAVQLFPAVRGRPERPAAPAADAPARRGVPLRLPRTASLDDPLALMRSLRPVGRRSIGGPGEELDEQLTVERSIEAMVPTPVLRPAESRWLDLALVVDTHPSMLLWSDLVDELRGVFTRSGVFRDVRTWQLTGTAPGGTPMLARGRGGPPRNPLELADPAGRRLILLVSDTVAGGWQETPLLRVLRHWSAHNAVAVLNVLPERLWTRGAVRPVPFAVRSDRPAAATRSWQRVPAARRARGGGPVVPVVGLASGSLARLVRTVSGDGRWRRLACLRLDAAPAPGTAPPRRAATALEAVERFRASASPTAQQLAAHLAAVPLTLPVMTLVRRSLLRDSEHGHLAEVALGGLFAPWEGQQRPEDAEFDFLPGVRDVLLGSQLRGDVAAVRELVRRRVWEFMYRHRGTGPDFSATRVTAGEEGRRRVPEGALPFAERPAEVPATERPGPDRGAGEGVVRVRFEPLAEPREAGTLLTPRLVLTAGDVAQPRDTLAWASLPDGREAACRPVWWDEASPRVLLLESEEDLADPGLFTPPTWERSPAREDTQVVVHGFADGSGWYRMPGDSRLYDGARNGEIVGISPELGDWIHFRGGPVLTRGGLRGVVHTVRPDRMVFLAAGALLGQDGFRAALGERAFGTAVTLALRSGGDGRVPAGAAVHRPPVDVLAAAMRAAEIVGSPEEVATGARIALSGPGAFVEAGLLLRALYRSVERERRPGAPLAVALAAHGPEGGAEATDLLLRSDTVTALRIGEPDRASRLVLTLSQSLYEELRSALGPLAVRPLKPLGEASGGWFLVGDPRRVAELLADAGEYRARESRWTRCGFAPSAESPAGCPGIRVTGRHNCLAHLPSTERVAHLATLRPGSPADFRGTPFTQALLGQLFDALREPETGRVRMGAADFAGARFTGGWEEEGVAFSGPADFRGAEFDGPVGFAGAEFAGEVSFERTVFRGTAVFDDAGFRGPASFSCALFGGSVQFSRAEWAEELDFRYAVTEGAAVFDAMNCEGPVRFGDALCKGRLVLGDSVFAGEVSFAHAMCQGGVSAVGTEFHGPVDFGHMMFQGDAAFHSTRFVGPARFASAIFGREAAFDNCRFDDGAGFVHTAFDGPVVFRETLCLGGASFSRAVFRGLFLWHDVRVDREVADFGGAVFHGSVRFSRVVFVTHTGFDGAVFHGSVTFADTHFEAGLTFAAATFRRATQFTDVTLARPIPLPGSWTVTESDGVWQITSPDPPEPGDA